MTKLKLTVSFMSGIILEFSYLYFVSKVLKLSEIYKVTEIDIIKKTCERVKSLNITIFYKYQTIYYQLYLNNVSN